MTTLKALQTKPNITFSAAVDPTQSIVGARVTDVYLNSVSGEQFRCVDATFGSQVWEGSQGTRVPSAILATDHPNLVAMYTMDNISGSTLNDESPNANNGTITGATQVAGKIGSALDFDNGKDVVSIYADGAAGFTVTFWVKFDSIKTVSGFCNWMFNNWQAALSSGDEQYLCATNVSDSNKITALFKTDAASNISIASSTIPTTGVWYFVAFGYDGSKGFISVDGETKLETAAFTLRSKTSEAIVFPHRTIVETGGNANNIPVDGQEDQIRIFDRDLTQSELTDVFNEGSP